MRGLILVLALALPLAACGKSSDAGEDSGAATMTANAISSNDITAIDAVTGEAANIAQDVQIDADLLADANGAGNDDSPSERRSRTAGPNGPSRERRDAPTASPEASSASQTDANTQ